MIETAYASPGRPFRGIFVCMLIVLASTAARSAAQTTLPPYDHLAVNQPVTIPAVLRDGQTFSINIEHTCVELFTYDMHGVPLLMRTVPAPPAGRAVAKRPLSTKTLTTKFDAQFGSYILNIHRNNEAVGKVECDVPDGGELHDVTIVIAVTPLTWEVGQDAALTLVGAPTPTPLWTTSPAPPLVQPAVGTDGKPLFAADGKTQLTTSTPQFNVVRDKDHEEPVRLAFATLTHLYAPGKDNGLALGFGLINNSPEYYFGWSWGLGPRSNRVVNLAGGFVYTPVTKLPPGIEEATPISDPAKLKDMTTAHRFRLFFGVTATFFKTTSGGAEKPPAPADQP